MMRGMMNAMRLQAMMEGEKRISTRLGIVSGGPDQDYYCAKVMLQPEGFETGWLPVASPWVGNGWGLFMPPTPGDVVLVTFQDDDINTGIITLRMFNDAARPLSVPSGEWWLVHKSGSLLKFHNDGTVELTAAGVLTVKGSEIDLVGTGGGTAKGIVQGDCLCAFTGQPHSMVSATVKATK